MRRGTALVLLLLATSNSWAADRSPNLNGIWHAPFTVEQGKKDEQVQIVQHGVNIRGTKITGDHYVSAGTMNFRARYTGAHFPAEQLCASLSRDFIWEAVSVTIIDKGPFQSGRRLFGRRDVVTCRRYCLMIAPLGACSCLASRVAPTNSPT
jgi:Cyclin D1 binding domain